MERCKHALGKIKKNEIGEDGYFCELTCEWQNITLGDCIGNCEAQEPIKQKRSKGE